LHSGGDASSFMLPGSFMCFLDDVLCYARAFGYKCALRAIQKKRKL